jgi:hypothetical protein
MENSKVDRTQIIKINEWGRPARRALAGPQKVLTVTAHILNL